ncbi:hypothetical protein [Paracoccus yeei]|jgi:hypothetical protein|uniref:hypothetical protein n=1 Tax=Paracoccus yeei TaxID=147645 RepID=UPI003BF8B2DE
MLRLLAVLASLTTVGAAAAHECDAILSSGVRNTYQVLQDGEFRNQFSSSYCDELGSKTGSGNSGGMNVGYKFFTFGASNNSSRNAEQFQKNCGSNSGQMSDAQFVSALQHVADQGIVQAWQQCISSTYGVMITAETASKGRLTVTYRFRAAGNVASAVVRGEPIFDGLTCNEGIKNGTVIDTGGLAQLCRRESEDDEVIIVLNTSFQPATLVIPPLVKPSEVKIPPPPRPALNKPETESCC